MTKEEMIERGWDTWYNPNYWVHPKTITDPTRQDFTNYGMSFEKAVEYELENKQPTPPGYDLGTAFQVLRTLNEITERLQTRPNDPHSTEPDSAVTLTNASREGE